MTPATRTAPYPTPVEEQDVTRETLRLLARLRPLRVVDGRIVIPAGATKELRARILRFEGELLWACGRESGPRWGVSWVPARPPESRRLRKYRGRRKAG